jgi:hypothetical protein
VASEPEPDEGQEVSDGAEAPEVADGMETPESPADESDAVAAEIPTVEAEAAAEEPTEA